MTPDAPIVVEVCPPELRLQALELLLHEYPPPERRRQAIGLHSAAMTNHEATAGLFVARNANGLSAACWAQLQPGGTGVLWRPYAPSEDSQGVVTKLLACANKFFDGHQVSLAQSLTLEDRQQGEQELVDAGYEHLTDLDYLVCLLRPKAASEQPQRLEYEIYSKRNHRRFRDTLERTYQGSLDCPELDGVRDMEDVLDGYRATGEYHPSRWMILRHGDHDVGCLLLADHAARDQWELVYLGLVPAARGDGLGFEATCFSTRLALGSRRNQMILAVDRRNAPARRMYERAGFVGCDSRSVYLRCFSDAPSS